MTNVPLLQLGVMPRTAAGRVQQTRLLAGTCIQRFSELLTEILSMKSLHWHGLQTGLTAHLISMIT